MHDKRKRKGIKPNSLNIVLESISYFALKKFLNNQEEIFKFVIKCAFKRTDI